MDDIGLFHILPPFPCLLYSAHNSIRTVTITNIPPLLFDASLSRISPFPFMFPFHPQPFLNSFSFLSLLLSILLKKNHTVPLINITTLVFCLPLLFSSSTCKFPLFPVPCYPLPSSPCIFPLAPLHMLPSFPLPFVYFPSLLSTSSLPSLCRYISPLSSPLATHFPLPPIYFPSFLSTCSLPSLFPLYIPPVSSFLPPFLPSPLCRYISPLSSSLAPPSPFPLPLAPLPLLQTSLSLPFFYPSIPQQDSFHNNNILTEPFCPSHSSSSSSLSLNFSPSFTHGTAHKDLTGAPITSPPWANGLMGNDEWIYESPTLQP